MRIESMSKTKTLSAAAAALMISFAAPAFAHHSAAAYFDLKQEITVTGTVDEFIFRAPHAVLRFKVKNDDGTEELWRAETLPANLLFHHGWRYNMFKVGEEVTITGNPARDRDIKAMELRKIVTGDGRVITPAGVQAGAPSP